MLPISRCNTIGFRLLLALSIIIITWMAITPIPEGLQSSVNDKVGHLLAFLYLSFMTHASWSKDTFSWRLRLPLIGYGIFLEVAQYFVPERQFSVADIVADAAGVYLYLLLLPLVVRITAKIFTLPENEM